MRWEMRRMIPRAAAIACCAWIAAAQAANTALATKDDYYWTVPKTTNICGRVMGENGDYRLVRNEDIAWLNEAWMERKGLTQGIIFEDAWPGGPLVKRGTGMQAKMIWCWAKANVETCVVTGATMAARLAEASGGAMTNVFYEGKDPTRLVSMMALTNEFAYLKKMDLVDADAVWKSFTNEQAVVNETEVRGYREYDGYGYENTNINQSVVEDSWTVEGRGYIYHWDGIKTDQWGNHVPAGEDWRSYTTEKEEVSGKLKMRLEWEVSNTNDWLRGEQRPKVVKSAKAYAAVNVYGRKEKKRKTYQVGQNQSGSWGWREKSNETEEWSTNATVLVELGEVEYVEAIYDDYHWIQCLVYEAEKDLAELTDEVAGKVAGMPGLSEVAAAAVVPEMEEIGEHEVKKSISCGIGPVYMVLEIKPVTSLPGW